MQQIVREHQTYPPKIVASVTSWELWKTLKGKDLTDQCDWVELRVDALPPELTAEQVMEFRPEMPLLVTVRCHEEGGLRRIPEEERFALLRAYMPYATAMDIDNFRLFGCKFLVVQNALLVECLQFFQQLLRRVVICLVLGTGLQLHAFFRLLLFPFLFSFDFCQHCSIPLAVTEPEQHDQDNARY